MTGLPRDAESLRGHDGRIEVAVLGRLGVDLPPDAPNVGLADVRTFTRAPGGFGGNVGTALARLGVRTSVVATVGDDGHGRFAREALASEGVEVGAIRLAAGLRTPLAFYEAWPPDHFPVTFYPTPAYWALVDAQLAGPILAAPLVLASATTLAHEPSRSLVLDALASRDAHGTVVDLDWRPVLWSDPTAAPALVRRAVDLAAVVVGGESEFDAVRLDPVAVSAEGRAVFLKRGEAGARYLPPGGVGGADVDPIRVRTVCGIGSGDAFVASVVEGIVRGRDPSDAARRANAAGAIVATRLACSAAMPTPDEIDALLAEVAVA